MDDPIAKKNFLALKQKSYAIKFNLDGTDYSPIETIGTGAYGVVCSAVNLKTEKKVAIKKIPSIFEQRTIAKRTYREIKILKHFKHDNIIAIQEILHPREHLDKFKDIYIVLDLMESDLHRIIHSSQSLTEEHVRFFTYQILRGLKYVHSANVVHRDLKPSNLLVNENCDLKIGDFGMARGMSSNLEESSMLMTQYVATRWYRAPELMILPKETYTEAVDMWSVGCILAEMIGRKQLFPGRSHIDQIERIIEKLGTPSKEYLKMTSSNIITSFILNKGRVKGMAWKDVYPKASKKALDLLGKMLILDPKKRITVNQALQHPFVNKYHDPEDEPVCIPVFNFDFEREDPNTEQLKKAIVEEVMEYHKPKPKPRAMQFNFRPVPKSELVESPPASKFNFKPVVKSELDQKTFLPKGSGTKEDTLHLPRGLEAFLHGQHSKETSEQFKLNAMNMMKATTSEGYFSDLSRQTSQGSSDGSKSEGSFETKHSQLVEDLEQLQSLQELGFKPIQGNFLQTQPKPEQGDGFVFKKPEGYPLSVKVKDTVKASEAAIRSSSDVEMWSAKSVGKAEESQSLSIETKPEESVDIEMPSAQSTGRDRSKESVEPVVPTEPPKPLDTKELIRMALLSNERKKQKEEGFSKPKPVTALQRQREREEKKRQKLEKAKLKKKKNKEKASSIELTDDDKKLLAKWQNMQKAPKPHRECSPATCLSEAIKNTRILNTDAANNATGSDTQPDLNAQGNKPSLDVADGSDFHLAGPVFTGSAIDIMQNAPGIPSEHNTVSVTTAQVGGIATTTSGATNTTLPLPQNTTNHGIFQSAFPDISQTGQISLDNAVPFSTYNWLEPRGEGNVPDVGSAFRAEVSPPRLPTYTEAVHAKSLHKDEWTNPASTMDPSLAANPLFSQTAATNSPDNASHLTEAQWLMSSLEGAEDRLGQTMAEGAAGPSGLNQKLRSKADHDMKIITKQLQKSNVEDLLLTNTPKGTGGGYGVACDFDLLMASGGADGKPDKPDSAQISPSLFTDWQDLTGHLDPRDFETVLHEYMTSPIISSQELNNVMLTLMSPRSSSKVS